MTLPTFKRAVRSEAFLRLALAGPAGSGKTYSALEVAKHLAPGGPIALIDTERGSAKKYAGDVADFDVLELESFHPSRYVEAIAAAEAAGYPVLIIDSLSHAWAGKDGALELVDRAAKRSQSGSSFAAWRDVTPLHNQLVDAMIGCRCHLIVTLRSRTEHVQEKDEKTGKTVVRKVGMAPVQRDGLEYEFDVYGDLTADNELIVGKTRCSALAGALIPKPGRQLAETLLGWLRGAPTEPPPPAPRPIPIRSKAEAAAVGQSLDERRASTAAERLQAEIDSLPDVTPAAPPSPPAQPSDGRGQALAIARELHRRILAIKPSSTIPAPADDASQAELSSFIDSYGADVEAWEKRLAAKAAQGGR